MSLFLKSIKMNIFITVNSKNRQPPYKSSLRLKMCLDGKTIVSTLFVPLSYNLAVPWSRKIDAVFTAKCDRKSM